MGIFEFSNVTFFLVKLIVYYRKENPYKRLNVSVYSFFKENMCLKIFTDVMFIFIRDKYYIWHRFFF